MQLTLEKGDGNFVWVMHIATRRGHEHIVRLMLDRGAVAVMYGTMGHRQLTLYKPKIYKGYLAFIT